MEKIIKKEDQQPDYIGHRQRLKARFIADLGRSMPDYEMLELLLTYALPRRDVKPLAKELIRHYLNLANVLVAPPDELMNLKGVGSNAAILLAAIHACARKITWENLENRDTPVFSDKKMIAEFCRSSIGHAGQEQLLVIYIDIHGKYLRDEIEQTGTIGSVMINPRDIVQKALMYKASRIIISHNHPSGDCTPSKSDIDMTKDLLAALKTVKIRLEDHIIISDRDSFSMRDHFPFMNIF